ncbi:MAG: LPS assembly lipoprotein LptE, partial [Rhodospirillales bacterium]|nr:LPS assembly lipoprotein LptE [Rhodospirillales bacterium]
EPIADRIGQLLHNDLLDRMNPFGKPQSPPYSLAVKVTESRQELAVQKTELATRANLKIVANFTLKKHGQKPAELLRGTGQATISYNILTANFATMMAEKDARRRAIREISAEITDKLASFFRLSGTAG